MSRTMNATVSLGKDYLENLHSIRNGEERPIVKKLFAVSHHKD